MAIRLPDGSIQMSDGRILYANSVILAQDLLELMPLFTPPPAWPFVSGGGGGGAGPQGPAGPAGTGGGGSGTQGQQGFQGTNPGVQGPQGNQGIVGAGVQGPQGNQGILGTQGNQGVAGAGVQGPQGFQGIEGVQGNQGNQGIAGAGFQGPQGFQGIEGVQGNQGNQGIAGAGVQGPQGLQGFQGFQGFQGTGVQGAQGFQGLLGPQGLAGFSNVAIFSFNHNSGTQSTGAIGFTPRFAIYFGAVNIGSSDAGILNGFATGTGTLAKGNAFAFTTGPGSPQLPGMTAATDADAIGGQVNAVQNTAIVQGIFTRDLDVTAFSAAGIDLTWSAAVNSHAGHMLVVG